ncbi:hypothetical protein GCM10018793_46070 [Streptomyces sulfonofaciens]|uniref:Uncharacterized protein n=1 Tax=Streptomyces sulfonofaciens TaxID=68272 RepID=A0A919GGE9_9ACTN|nr:hypothetical protein GCM10018793_46070 [Streptomyces sulfonofaciens]
MEARREGTAGTNRSTVPPFAATCSVRVGPGATGLTRTPAGPSSAAQDRVTEWTVGFLAP